jgi:hypothetical protein
LMEFVSSCIFLSWVLGCLTNSFSVFPLITISSSSSEILSSACCSLLEWPPFCFVFLSHTFFLSFSISWITSPIILPIFALNSFISVFMVFSVSLWCLFRAPMISFICFCVFSYSLFLLSWSFLSASCCFDWRCLVTSLWNSHRLFVGFLLSGCSCGLHWVSWYSLPLFCRSLHLDICFLHFPLNSVLIYFGEQNGFHCFFIFPSFHLVLFQSLVYV